MVCDKAMDLIYDRAEITTVDPKPEDDAGDAEAAPAMSAVEAVAGEEAQAGAEPGEDA